MILKEWKTKDYYREHRFETESWRLNTKLKPILKEWNAKECDTDEQ